MTDAKLDRIVLRLGYKASAEQFGPRKLCDFAGEAEGAGFDSVFISDHFQPWRHSDGHAPFAFAVLGAMCEHTERVLLGTSVTTPTFRFHPAIVAQAFGTLGVLFPDRMILGVGSGEHLNEGALGVQWPDIRERFARLRESNDAMPLTVITTINPTLSSIMTTSTIARCTLIYG